MEYKPTIADRLLGATAADLDSADEWERARRFFYDALSAVRSQLPEAAQEQLAKLGPELPTDTDLVAAQVALWRSIEADSMRNRPEGAAVRAALLAFDSPKSEGPFDTVAVFCDFFIAAGLPETVLVGAFREQWPETLPGK